LAEPLRSDSEMKLIPFTSMLFEIFAIGMYLTKFLPWTFTTLVWARA
jgi:hypothetical protein